MATCTFFGHRNTSDEIKEELQGILINLIENKNVYFFYVGNQGNFDHLVIKSLNFLKKKYSNIDYAIVLAYIPGKKDNCCNLDYSKTICPAEIEKTPPKYAICKRNQWMINRSDYVVTHIKHFISNAAQFKDIAEKKGKTVINI